MDILKFVLSILVLVEYTPKQLQEFGCTLPEIIWLTVVIYLIRTIVEVVIIRLGIDIVEVFIKFIAEKIKKIFKLDNKIDNNNWLVRLWGRVVINHNQTKDKVINFFRMADDFGILVSNAIPFMPTSIPALLYNLRRHKSPWYKFNNLSFVALIVGGIIRIAIVIIWLEV